MSRRAPSPGPTSTPEALEAELRCHMSAARSASTPAAGRCTPPTARTTARCRSASSSRDDQDDVVATVAAGRAVRRPGPVARRRHQPGRPVLQRRRRHGLLQVPAPRPRASTRTRKLGTVQPGCVLDDLRDAAERARPDLRPRPGHAQPLHPGRHARQRLLRLHSLLCGQARPGLRTADNTHELEVLTYDGLRLRVGATPPDELERIIRAGGRRGEIYAKLKAFARPVRRRDPRGFPKLPRRVSGYNLTRCCRRTASTSPGPWSARRARWSPSWKRR